MLISHGVVWLERPWGGILVLAETGQRDTCKAEEEQEKQVWTMWQVRTLSLKKQEKGLTHLPRNLNKKSPNFLTRPVPLQLQRKDVIHE